MSDEQPEKQQEVKTASVDYFLKEGFYIGRAKCLNCGFEFISVLPPDAKNERRNVACPECNSRGNTFRHITLKNKVRVLKGFNN